jgi:hypothetical protein
LTVRGTLREMAIHKALLAAACVGIVTACGGGGGGGATTSSAPKVDLAKVFAVKSTFGPNFTVSTTGPSGIDPLLLQPPNLPAGVVFDPGHCAKYATGELLPADLKGNMAAVLAEGEGNRFIAMAVETSDPVPFESAAADKCQHVTFTGPNMHGVVDVVDSPQIAGAQTQGTHRQMATPSGSGELFNYVANLQNYLVIVTANPLVVPKQPVPPVNTQRARDLLTAAVGALRG